MGSCRHVDGTNDLPCWHRSICFIVRLLPFCEEGGSHLSHLLPVCVPRPLPILNLSRHVSSTEACPSFSGCPPPLLRVGNHPHCATRPWYPTEGRLKRTLRICHPHTLRSDLVYYGILRYTMVWYGMVFSGARPLPYTCPHSMHAGKII